jgi:uncharacterized membrane protein YkvA (DUF1232 family)
MDGKKVMERELDKRTSRVSQEDVRKTAGRTEDFEIFLSFIPSRLFDFAARARLFFEMLRDYASGNYTNLPWRTVATLTATCLYLLTPIDIIPDFIAFFGLIDDAALLYAAMHLIREDLLEYIRFKSYDEDYYF